MNYGKGYLGDYDVKDLARWNDEIGRYVDSTGIWSTELLLEIAQGKVKNMSVEVWNDV